MYQLISALVKPVEKRSRWKYSGVGNETMATLFRLYSKVYLELSHPMLIGNRGVDLEIFRADYAASSKTLNEVLAINASTTLEFMEELPKISTQYLRYADAFHAGYKVQPINPAVGAGVDEPIAAKTYLALTKNGMDYQKFYEHCLVAVNGFFHLTDTDGLKALVVDGMKSAVLAKQYQVGVYSFQDVGKIQLIPITADKVYRQNDREKYADHCHVDLGVNLNNKSVMLVLGGYLHVLDEAAFYRVSDTSVAINLRNLPLLDRYFDSKKYIDLSSLPLQSTVMNPDQISVEEFYSDENLLAYLTLSQSFFVVMDCDDIFIENTPTRPTRIPGLYVTHVVPQFPLLGGFGKMLNYWYSEEDGQYALNCCSAVTDDLIYETSSHDELYSVSNQSLSVGGQKPSTAFIMKLGRDV